MQRNKYIYSFGYDETERELCKLESKCIFKKEEKNKTLFSELEIKPSDSAFIKKRLDIILSSDDYTSLLNGIERAGISVEGFKVEYLVLDGDTTEYAERLEKLRDIGYRIAGNPDYYSPSKTYALCFYEGVWYFGILVKNDFAWKRHKQKPCSNSNSIKINIAKALVNIAAQAVKDFKLIDACCGVGTVMLEACFAGYDIEGCDINWKQCRDARDNLSHFNYTAKVYRSDIKYIIQKYDAAIVDLPYNLLTRATDNDMLHIIESTAKITDRLVIVSTLDISNFIIKSGLSIRDHCKVSKSGRKSFTRNIWVCEKDGEVLSR